MFYKALMAAFVALALTSGPATAQSTNAPPVVDTFTTYWTPHPQLADTWNLHLVVRVHDPDSARVFARVLVLDRMQQIAVDVLFGTEEEGERTIESDGWFSTSAGVFDHIEMVASDSDGNMLDSISISIPDPPGAKTPSLRAAKLTASKSAVLLSGKQMRRVVGVELNGTEIPVAQLSIRKDGKKLRISGADGALPLGDGLNSLRVVTEAGRSNELLLRK